MILACLSPDPAARPSAKQLVELLRKAPAGPAPSGGDCARVLQAAGSSSQEGGSNSGQEGQRGGREAQRDGEKGGSRCAAWAGGREPLVAPFSQALRGQLGLVGSSALLFRNRDVIWARQPPAASGAGDSCPLGALYAEKPTKATPPRPQAQHAR